ncbi:ubiquitin-conjugating enzyme/RWD-like protein [Jimgerdemannia flammicorona]|uniref:Ubiquitin-conjugating enzyme/RWD-like protein n=1 Tax=Jimgerdemannia flammicorona TaxID=994334 RepID=A0A433QE01_9FUNG|nr:ubiquitin-conjugating enzyme/RWD-like protein [Jimgerdemannia flammicorona]
MDTVSRRLLKELHDPCENPDILELRLVDDDDLLNWRALLRGATGTAYEGGVFELRITVPQSYPIHPPTIKFVTTICHPNVHFKSGEICLDILKTTWSPAWTLQSTLLAISLLLVHPEPSSPLNCDAANLLRCGDIDGYNSLVRMYTELYAMDHVSSDEEGCIEEEGMLESAVLVEQQESSFAGVDGHSGMVSVG